jgi:ABC-type branched-subunit amino acid transport system ATPase component
LSCPSGSPRWPAIQNLAFALRVDDHVYVMSKGRIVLERAPDELRRDE